MTLSRLQLAEKIGIHSSTLYGFISQDETLSELFTSCGAGKHLHPRTKFIKESDLPKFKKRLEKFIEKNNFRKYEVKEKLEIFCFGKKQLSLKTYKNYPVESIKKADGGYFIATVLVNKMAKKGIGITEQRAYNLACFNKYDID